MTGAYEGKLDPRLSLTAPSIKDAADLQGNMAPHAHMCRAQGSVQLKEEVL